jgi:hypothetical protein
MRVMISEVMKAIVALSITLAFISPVHANNELHPGPAAWLEEYWDVKPDRFDEFVKTYREQVYSLARRVPGYRGYVFLTNIPDPAAPTHPNLFGEKMIIPHYGVHMNGTTFTGRAVNIGNLIRRTHNVVIVHTLRSWADADAFRGQMDKLFAQQSKGEKLGDHLAKTLYPLANNFWEADFHLQQMGVPLEPGVVTKGKDADGLNLQPQPSNSSWYKEYFQVDPQELSAFLDAYEETYDVMRPIPGYRGVSVVTSIAPTGAEAERSHYRNQVLGGSPEMFVPFPGMLMDGSIKTDTAINFSALFKQTFTIITYYEVPWDAKLLEPMQKNWEALGNQGDRLAHVTQKLFPHARNHWDMQYRAIETSLVPVVQ